MVVPHNKLTANVHRVAKYGDFTVVPNNTVMCCGSVFVGKGTFGQGNSGAVKPFVIQHCL